MPRQTIGSSAAPLRMTWLGHATFVLQTPGGVTVVIDPWLTTNPACRQAWRQIDRAEVVLVTHGHADHIGDLIPVTRSTGAGVVAIVELCHWLETKGVRKLHPMNKGGMMPEGRRFTLVEAQQLLPSIRTLTEKAVNEAAQLSNDLQRLSATDPARSVTVEALEGVVAVWTDRVRGLGLDVKGLWLVDFDNGEGYYCWKYPEPEVLHFHGYEEGFAGRMKIV